MRDLGPASNGYERQFMRFPMVTDLQGPPLMGSQSTQTLRDGKSSMEMHIENTLQRTGSLRPYVSPILEKLTDTPFARKQLAFRFKVDEGAAAQSAAAKREKPIQLASVSFARQQVRGTLHVRADLHINRVFVRYTCDSWATLTDADATFIGKECYFFNFSVPNDVKDSDCVAFVFACELTDGSCIWDNNNGVNYNAEVVPLPQGRQCSHHLTAGRISSMPQSAQNVSS